MSIPIFDSLAHPTVSGKWLKGENSELKELLLLLNKNNFCGACLVGMDNVESYDHNLFMDMCEHYKSMFSIKICPVAGFNPLGKEKNEIKIELLQIKALGYKGIKIHPRFSKIPNINTEKIAYALEESSCLNLPVFICTYSFCEVQYSPAEDLYTSLVKLLKRAPECKVVLVHGGTVEVLKYAELVRFNPNLLLDLSLTILKYSGSSLDHDLRFLFANFDKRICIGSDYPEYTHQELREKFNCLSEGITHRKKERIAHENILNFLEP
jgi:predicted TIM-barrel fold metal-dependent hydrolase